MESTGLKVERLQGKSKQYPPQDLLYLGVRIKTTDTKDAECGQDSRWGRVPGTAGERLPLKFSKAKAGEENKHLLTSRKQIPSITGRSWIL